MNLLKTPHQMLLEEAGAKIPSTNGMLKNPHQLLMEESGLPQQFAPGGKVAKGVLSLLDREANKAKFLQGTKVVDYNGKPIPMYHHTTDFKGDAFNPALAQQKDQGYHGQGMYFGADDYLKRSAFGKHSFGNVYGEEGFTEGSQVMPVNLSIKNPKYVDVTEQSLHGMPIEKLKEMGHDGVIVTRDDSFQNVMGRTIPRQKVYNAVAFEPTQIKSAIGNEGTYDPLDPRLHKADGGHIQMSPQDMMATMIAHGQEPQHFKTGGHSIKNLLKDIKSQPKQSLYNLFGFSDAAMEAYNAVKHAREGKPVHAMESGFNAAAAIPSALPGVPVAASLAVPYGGQAITQEAANYMAQQPEYRNQMMNMSSAPLGGALGGDSALAAHIMGNRDYADVLQSRQPPEIIEEEPGPRRQSLLYQKTMGIK